MEQKIIEYISKELNIKDKQTQTVLQMLTEGNTVPFIARYRKEATGALDEEAILFIEKQYKYQLSLLERKQAVIELISQQGKLDDNLKNQIMACEKLSQVEDLYKPYKLKKKTRAAEAIRKGLQPLADHILSLPKEGDLYETASSYLNEEVKDAQEAVKGAMDIIAEAVSDDAKLRWKFKDLIVQTGMIETKIRKDAQDEKKVYELYYDHSERVNALADHRVMAINRAEKEKVITVTMSYDQDHLFDLAYEKYGKSENFICEKELKEAIWDGMKRLLLPSIENEIRSDLSERAQKASIEIFSDNVEKLLSQAPLKGRTVLGFDPGFYNGCKLAVVDETGKMLKVEKIYPFRKGSNVEKDKTILKKLIESYKVRTIAIGNGTASRESERFVAEVIKEGNLDTTYCLVSEAGASVWSAQEEARMEFPDLQVEERSAVSIARRLLDPLSELIKIDPKSIGVGQYQHDLPEKQLSERLDEATMKVVNRVGADVNTASVELLRHISGLNNAIAKEIISYRNENGRFTDRSELMKVKKLGPKSYTQCAGFLRITDGKEALDSTSIHPESYDIAHKIMEVSNIEMPGQADIVFNEEEIGKLDVDEYTLADIKESLKAPLRDYRDQFEGALLKSDILEISDLKVGDELSGTVRNVVSFGAFVDVGLHEDGLIHVSRMSKNRVSDPFSVLSVNDIVKVYVYDVDEQRGRVQLSLLPLEELKKRDAVQKNFRNKKKKKEEEVIDEEEAMKRLLERFSPRYKK